MSQASALIIDDNVDNREILEALLEAEGLAYRTYSKIKTAEEIDDLPQVDILFLDLELPGLTGYELFELFKADKRFRDVPIVAYTVHLSEIKVLQHMGFHSFLGKPLDADTFPEYLHRILNGEGVWVY
jgi:CheY-like chemotaxis protein